MEPSNKTSAYHLIFNPLYWLALIICFVAAFFFAAYDKVVEEQ